MIAAEFAILFSALAIPFMFGMVWLFQLWQLKTALTFIAMSAAGVGHLAIVGGTDPTAAANTVITANAGLLQPGTLTTPIITVNGQTITVSITGTVPALIPVGSNTDVSYSTSATD
jgi:hypothetical protein